MNNLIKTLLIAAGIAVAGVANAAGGVAHDPFREVDIGGYCAGANMVLSPAANKAGYTNLSELAAARTIQLFRAWQDNKEFVRQTDQARKWFQTNGATLIDLKSISDDCAARKVY